MSKKILPTYIIVVLDEDTINQKAKEGYHIIHGSIHRRGPMDMLIMEHKNSGMTATSGLIQNVKAAPVLTKRSTEEFESVDIEE